MTNETIKKIVLDYFGDKGITEPDADDVIQLYDFLNGQDLEITFDRIENLDMGDPSIATTLYGTDLGHTIILEHSTDTHLTDAEEVADYVCALNDRATLVIAKFEAARILADFADEHAEEVYGDSKENIETLTNAAAIVRASK